jgi:hypothetical protein
MQRSTLTIYVALVILLLTQPAFACGDPGIIFIVSAIGAFQIMLTAVILFSRKDPWLERIKFSGLYFVSLVGTWVLSERFIHVWFDEPGRNVFSLIALLIGPIVSIYFLRWKLVRKRKNELRDAG